MRKFGTLFIFTVCLCSVSRSSFTFSIDNLPPSVAKGSVRLLTASYGTPPYTWSSSDPSVVSVDSITGLMTAVDTGTAVISVVGISDSTSQSVTVMQFGLSMPVVSMHVKDTVVVPVSITDVTALNLFSFDLDIQYDPAALTFVGLDTAGLFANGWLTSYASIGDTIRIATAGGNPYDGADTTVVNLFFTAVDSTNVLNSTFLHFLKLAANELPASVAFSDGTVDFLNDPPVFTIVFSDTAIVETDTLVLPFSAYDPNGNSPVYFSLTGQPAGMDVLPTVGTVVWVTTYSDSGTYQANLWAHDAYDDSVSFHFSVQVLNLNRPPLLDPTFPDSFMVSENDTLTFHFTATDPDSDKAVFVPLAVPPGLSLDSLTGDLLWVPTYQQAGSYVVPMLVRDSLGAASLDTFFVAVYNVDRPPLFTAVMPDTVIAAGDTLSYHYAAFDLDSDLVSVSLEFGPPGATMDSAGQFLWYSSPGDQGEYAVVVSITDGLLTVFDTTNVRINAPGDVSGNGTVSSYDASLILQDQVERIALSPLQRSVANVSGDSTVSSYDASLILQYVVGLIASFPSEGGGSVLSVKDAGAGSLAAPFEFRLERGNAEGLFDLVIQLNAPSRVYGMTVSIAFDTSIVLPKSLKRESLSDSMSFAYFFPSGRANFSLAALRPLKTAGDIARFSFVLKDPGLAPDAVIFTPRRFILNESDVTASIPSVTLDVKKFFNLPASYELQQNYPNPFNPYTTVAYQLPSLSRVSLRVFNLIGQEVKVLVDAEQAAGFYTTTWDGTTNQNKPVASGVYLCRMEARGAGGKSFVTVRKMILMK